MKWVNFTMRALPWSMYEAQCCFLDPPLQLYTHYGLPLPLTYNAYIFFCLQPLQHHLSHNVCSTFLLKNYQTLNQWKNSENNINLVFCFLYVYKENAKNFPWFFCTWLAIYLIPRASSTLRYFSTFLCFNFS